MKQQNSMFCEEMLYLFWNNEIYDRCAVYFSCCVIHVVETSLFSLLSKSTFIKFRHLSRRSKLADISQTAYSNFNFLSENHCILTNISMTSIPKDPISNDIAFVLKLARWITGYESPTKLTMALFTDAFVYHFTYCKQNRTQYRFS